MALITCPECKNEASSTAQACPHCGFALADFVMREQAARIQREMAAQKKVKDERTAKVVLACFVFGSMFCCCSNVVTSRSERRQQEEQRQAAKLKAEQEAKEKAVRVADTKSNMDTHVERLKIKIEGESLQEAMAIYGLIYEAEPQHPFLPEAKLALEGIQQKQKIQKMREDAVTSKTQADERATAKQYVDADDLYAGAISSIEAIPEDQRTKEDSDLAAAAKKAKAKVSKKADKIRTEQAKAYADAAAKVERCGGTTNCIETTANQLCMAYDNNEVRADGVYKGRTLVITGRVESISKGITDDMFVNLSSPYNCLSVIGNMANNQKSNMAAISKGDKITIRCIGAGLWINTPISNDCVLVEYWSRN